MSANTDKLEIIQEIQRRIQHLIASTEISDEQKIIIARKVLNLIEHGSDLDEQ